jgi:hypothetical protein
MSRFDALVTVVSIGASLRGSCPGCQIIRATKRHYWNNQKYDAGTPMFFTHGRISPKII